MRTTTGKDTRPVRRPARHDPERLAGKAIWKPGTMLAPVPAVMVSCGNLETGPRNIITIAWAGTVCSEPPMVSISIRPERFSYDIIRDTKEFAINLATVPLIPSVDYCGICSGRTHDKFAETGLTPARGSVIAAPLIAESPVNLECRLRKILPLGSHDLFLAEIVAVDVAEGLIDRRGQLHLESAGLAAFSHGHYYALGKLLGKFGYSTRMKRFS